MPPYMSFLPRLARRTASHIQRCSISTNQLPTPTKPAFTPTWPSLISASAAIFASGCTAGYFYNLPTSSTDTQIQQLLASEKTKDALIEEQERLISRRELTAQSLSSQLMCCIDSYNEYKGLLEDVQTLCVDYLELVAAQHETITTLIEEREEDDEQRLLRLLKKIAEEKAISNRDRDADYDEDDDEDDS
ncbi:hypothetical protein HBH56_036760 [Parastagonospora nodorum]|uniref:Uncharacterized protein n=1 Tax=Phaeosphaeria nodorum (strain SN15 / ATCC MYA-4574 / FGSC 10173) TaxID=321614 RepID=A0A7U2I5E1_PHANO|nr:hypothetical protein HBH56_036760 [Parastagonospora nodorum]QRD00003.1 hypothetical protein JI435_069200 [Parastagonospora nodorum SN15]KAH3933493.1 hypothetical protein HBH54_062710 [Parastagonospora nodorum]KAH3979889.1 hypothetical protein HBH51_058410 [Parastagonospora nodorum]KAH3980248.1 hypothetical protein HBH52_094560 [Parastagonospora nodorum]